jgi:hypothetical protein
MRKRGRLSTPEDHRHHDTMLFLSVLFQIATDWIRDIVLDVLGRRADEFLGRIFKRRGRRRKAKRRPSRRFDKNHAG